MDFPGGASGKESAWESREHKKNGVGSLVQEDPLEEGTRAFLPGESYGQRSLVGYIHSNAKSLATTEATACTEIHFCLIRLLFHRHLISEFYIIMESKRWILVYFPSYSFSKNWFSTNPSYATYSTFITPPPHIIGLPW